MFEGATFMHGAYNSTSKRIDENETVGYFKLNETDRRIKEKLLQIENRGDKKKNKGILDSVAALIKKMGEKNIAPEQDYSSSAIRITDTATIAFHQLNSTFSELFRSDKLIGGTSQRALLLPGRPQIGDMKFFKFDEPTINISMQNENVLISPHYIFRFGNDWKYKCTYSPLAIAASLVTYSTKEHKDISKRRQSGISRKDGIVSNTANKDMIKDVLKLEIADLSLFFYTNMDYERGVVEIVNAYSDTEIQEEFDPAFHIMGLLKRCDFESKNVKRLEKLVEENDTY